MFRLYSWFCCCTRFHSSSTDGHAYASHQRAPAVISMYVLFCCETSWKFEFKSRTPTACAQKSLLQFHIDCELVGCEAVYAWRILDCAGCAPVDRGVVNRQNTGFIYVWRPRRSLSPHSVTSSALDVGLYSAYFELFYWFMEWGPHQRMEMFRVLLLIGVYCILKSLEWAKILSYDCAHYPVVVMNMWDGCDCWTQFYSDVFIIAMH